MLHRHSHRVRPLATSIRRLTTSSWTACEPHHPATPSLASHATKKPFPRFPGNGGQATPRDLTLHPHRVPTWCHSAQGSAQVCAGRFRFPAQRRPARAWRSRVHVPPIPASAACGYRSAAAVTGSTEKRANQAPVSGVDGHAAFNSTLVTCWYARHGCSVACGNRPCRCGRRAHNLPWPHQGRGGSLLLVTHHARYVLCISAAGQGAHAAGRRHRGLGGHVLRSSRGGLGCSPEPRGDEGVHRQR